jgi:pullulanase/glycogen debranching enzyme
MKKPDQAAFGSLINRLKGRKQSGRQPLGVRTMEIRPGTPYPLGATYDGAGTNFSLFSEIAEGVELCLIDEQGQETMVDLPEVTGIAGMATCLAQAKAIIVAGADLQVEGRSLVVLRHET